MWSREKPKTEEACPLVWAYRLSWWFAVGFSSLVCIFVLSECLFYTSHTPYASRISHLIIYLPSSWWPHSKEASSQVRIWLTNRHYNQWHFLKLCLNFNLLNLFHHLICNIYSGDRCAFWAPKTECSSETQSHDYATH